MSKELQEELIANTIFIDGEAFIDEETLNSIIHYYVAKKYRRPEVRVVVTEINRLPTIIEGNETLN